MVDKRFHWKKTALDKQHLITHSSWHLRAAFINQLQRAHCITIYQHGITNELQRIHKWHCNNLNRLARFFLLNQHIYWVMQCLCFLVQSVGCTSLRFENLWWFFIKNLKWTGGFRNLFNYILIFQMLYIYIYITNVTENSELANTFNQPKKVCAGCGELRMYFCGMLSTKRRVAHTLTYSY